MHNSGTNHLNRSREIRTTKYATRKVAVTRHSSLVALRNSLELKEQLAYYHSGRNETKGRAIAIAQPWEDLKKLLMERYCPGNAIKELKEEFWNHVMIGADVDKIKRYIDTKPNHELIHYCLENPPYQLDWTNIKVPVSEGSPITTTTRIRETYKNVSQDIRDQLNAKAKAVQIILTGIDNDNYSTVDAYNSPRINRSVGYENQRNGNVAGAISGAEIWEKMLLCKQEEAGIQLNAEQADWRDDTDDDELEDQELEAHYMYMAQLQDVSNDDHYNVFAMENVHPEQSKSVHDTYPIEQDAKNVIIDSLDMSYDREEIDQNANDNDLATERDLLASLIEKLKCEIDESKNRNKFLETSNKALIDKLKELKDKLSAHQETIYILSKQKEAQIKLYKTREYKELDKVIELENKVKEEMVADLRYFNSLEFEVDSLRSQLETQKTQFSNEIDRHSREYYYADHMNAILGVYTELDEEEMVADLRYFNSLEFEFDTLRSQLETQKTQFSNEIDRLSREYYYADHMNAILGVYTELDEVTNLQCDYLEMLQKYECLEIELSKRKMMSKSFESVQKHAINLELELQRCKEKVKNDMSFKVNKSKDFYKEHEQYFEIQYLKAQLQDKGIVISELKKLIEKLKGKYVDTKFEKSSVIRQPNAFKSQRPSVLGKPTTFSNSFIRKDFSKSTSVTQNKVSNDFSKPVTAQTLLTNKKPCLKNTNVLAPGMYKLHTDHTQARTSKLPQDSKKTNKRVSFSTGVILTTSVSRPPLKSNPHGDRVMHNNS
nr:reverse transcriptase domain-containing protein [Tanacetum cinerariifolium]